MAFGPNRDNVIENSYSRSNVIGLNQMSGGFYGYAQQNGQVKNVYSTGTVYVAPDSTGGFVGKVGNFVATNAFYDHTQAPIDAVGGFDGPPLTLDIMGKSTAEMKTAAFRDQLNQGNANGVWAINPSINDGYPYLGTQPLLASLDVKKQKATTIAPSLVENSFQIFSEETQLNYRILDMSGKIIQSGSLNGNQKTVQVNGLTKGNYLILIQTKQGSETLKFIKK